MDKLNIVYFVDSKGRKPIKDFLDSSSPKQQAKILRVFHYIKEYGLHSIIPHLKKLTGTPLWEIRILGKDNLRVLYVLEYKNIVLVLHCFIKKTQKIDKKDVAIALYRYNE